MTHEVTTEENTEPTEEISDDTKENPPVYQSTHEIKSKRSIRTEKQLEALAKAREKAFAVRREKAQRKKKEKESKIEKQSVNQPEPDITSAFPDPDPEPEPEEVIEKHMVRSETKRNLTFTEAELNNLIENTVNVTLEKSAKPKKKYKLINGIYVLQ